MRPEERIEEVAERVAAARAATVLQHAIGAQRPAGCGRDAQTQAGESGITRGETVLEDDPVRVLHLRQEHFVLESEARDRLVVRQRDRRQRLRLRADDHGAVRERRKPVIAIADVQLGILEAQTQHGAGRNGVIFIGDAAETQDDVVARLPVTLKRCLPCAVARHAMPVRQSGHGPIDCRDLGARMRQAELPHVAIQVASNAAAKHRIDSTRGGQCIEHRRGCDRPDEHGVVGEYQYTLDLPFDFGRQVEGKVGTRPSRPACRAHRRCKQAKT